MFPWFQTFRLKSIEPVKLLCVFLILILPIFFVQLTISFNFAQGAMAIHHAIADDILLHCDRIKSAEARYALERLVWQPLQSEGLVFLSSCPLLRENDILHAQESSKYRRADDLWVCQLCQKVFISEHFLDRHFARRHAKVRDAGTVCFADLCGVVIPCMPLFSIPSRPVVSTLHEPRDLSDIEDKQGICNDTGLRNRHVAACAHVIRLCFAKPNERIGFATSRALERLERDLCERAIEVRCVHREKVWEVLGRPDQYLQPRVHSPAGYLMSVALVLMVLFVSSWAFRCWQENGRREKRKTRRLKKKR